MSKRPQHLVALDRANVVRLGRAALKRRISTEGLPLVIRTLKNPPGYTEGMRVVHLLTALPGIGEVRAKRLMVRADVRVNGAGWRSARVGELTRRERIRLAGRLKALKERREARP